MKRPSALVYGADDSPPAAVVWLNGLQHVGMIAVFLVVPLAICRAADASPAVSRSVLSISMVAVAIGTLLQMTRRGPLGAGYLAPNGPSAIYLGPCLVAAQIGGLPLVFGMTIFAGAIEMLVSRILHRVRAFLPPELSGLVVLMIGVSFSALGIQLLLGGRGQGPVGAADWSIAAFTLFVTVILNIWSRGLVKMMCALVGLVAGYAAAALAGVTRASEFAEIAALPWIDAPSLGHLAWTFDPALALPFAVAGVAVAINVSASITVYQRMHDAEWVRPELTSIRRGTLTDGMTTIIATGMGGYGLSVLAASTGLIVATQVAARRIALAVAAGAIVFAFLPKLAALLVATPDAVVAGAAFFASAFVIANGMQIITSRMLDPRRALTIGLAIITSLAVLMFPNAAASAPNWVRPIVSSPLVAGMVTGFLLNLIFRIGVKKTVSTKIDIAGDFGKAIEDFLNQHGATWGARHDVIRRAIFGATQLAEAVIEHCQPQSRIILEASFDEFNLDLAMHYRGDALELPDTRPKDREILASEDGARRLAGFMLRRNADRVTSGLENGTASVRFHFDH